MKENLYIDDSAGNEPIYPQRFKQAKNYGSDQTQD